MPQTMNPPPEPAAAAGAGPTGQTFSADERNAMRAFLQRCEVRLSTMHRVGTAFVSGAGLLVLLPMFLKDGIAAVVRSILAYNPRMPDTVTLASGAGIVLVYVGLSFAFLLSLAIPIAAMILLIKDLVRFYFDGHPPGFSEDLFNPRFILTGIAFSPDESAAVKQNVVARQYGSDLMNFVISYADKRSDYYYGIIDQPDHHIVPKTRTIERLVRDGILRPADGRPATQLAAEDIVIVGPFRQDGTGADGMAATAAVSPAARMAAAADAEAGPIDPERLRSVRDIDSFNAALGLAGFTERSLEDEVAKSEVSLVRHAVKLRRLVLRYFQALMIIIWTSIVTLLMLPFLQQEPGRFPLLVVMTAAYFIWALFAPLFVRMPLHWTADLSKNEIQRTGVDTFLKSDPVQRFGRNTQLLCRTALAGAALAMIIEIAMRLG